MPPIDRSIIPYILNDRNLGNFLQQLIDMGEEGMTLWSYSKRTSDTVQSSQNPERSNIL